MSLLGLDIGSSCAKAIAFNEEGKEVASSQVQYNMIFPKSGWIEIDAESMKKNILNLLAEINSKLAGDPVKAVSVISFGEGVIPVDDKGNIIYNIIYPLDCRSIIELDYIIENINSHNIYEITGTTPSYIYTLSKILWLKNNLKDIYKKTKKFYFVEDFVQSLLGIKDTKVSYSLASRSMFFDIVKNKWSQVITEKFDIDIEKFSVPVNSGEIIAVISNKIKEELGFKLNANIVIGGHDQPCAALGAGVIEEDSAANGMGTVESIIPVFKNIIINEVMEKNNFCCEPHVINGKYITLAYNMTAGSIVKWFKDNIWGKSLKDNQDKRADFYRMIYSKLDFKPSGLFVLPYFGPSGTPYFYPKSIGSIIGLSINSDKEEIFKAIIESFIYEMKFNIELLNRSGIDLKELKAIGKGAESDYWLQLKSNILNVPVIRMKTKEAGCVAGAMLAGMALGNFKNISEATSTFIKIEKEFYPGKVSEIFFTKYEKYKKLFNVISSFLNVNLLKKS